MSSLVQWANGWFLSPSSATTPSNDRAWMFAALVDLLTSGLKARADYHIVHDIFTYLLRGWNPVTAWVHPSSYLPAGESYFTDEYKATIKALMNFESEPDIHPGYALLAHYSRSSVRGLFSQSEYEEEQKTLMLLAFWLIKRPKSFSVPKDIVLVRACMDLYHRHKDESCNDLTHEYIGNKLFYMRWINDLMTAILSSDLPFKQAIDEIIYLAMFACLIRAVRMTSRLGTDMVWAGENLQKTLESEVGKIRAYIDRYPLVVTETGWAKRRNINLLGCKLKRLKRE